MTGYLHYSIEKSDSFDRSLKKLAKTYQRDAKFLLKEAIEGLATNPYPLKSREEPLPSKTSLAIGWTFHKLEIRVGKGASGQVRLMYLVNEESSIVKLVWIYNHEQFAKRPEDRDLRDVLNLAFESDDLDEE